MSFVKVETNRGWEVWPNAEGSELVATFAHERAANHFIATHNVPNFQQIALKVAQALPDLNCSNRPINPTSELVLNVARIIEQTWLLGQ